MSSRPGCHGNTRAVASDITRSANVSAPSMLHNVNKREKKNCQCLQKVKVPQAYPSNIKSLVSVNDLKLVGLESHDCHVLMQQLLVVQFAVFCLIKLGLP